MKRIRIELAKTHGEPFLGFKTLYLLPTITFTYYKSVLITTDLYIEFTWLFYMVRVTIFMKR